jgi:hypothetical protein
MNYIINIILITATEVNKHVEDIGSQL